MRPLRWDEIELRKSRDTGACLGRFLVFLWFVSSILAIIGAVL